MHHTCQILWKSLLPPEDPLSKPLLSIWLDIFHVYLDILIPVRPGLGVWNAQTVQELMYLNRISLSNLNKRPYPYKKFVERFSLLFQAWFPDWVSIIPTRKAASCVWDNLWSFIWGKYCKVSPNIQTNNNWVCRRSGDKYMNVEIKKKICSCILLNVYFEGSFAASELPARVRSTSVLVGGV